VSQGDGNNDGNVDAEDLAIWESLYGTSALSALSASSPSEVLQALVIAASPTDSGSTVDASSLVGVAQLVQLSEDQSEAFSKDSYDTIDTSSNVDHGLRKSRLLFDFLDHKNSLANGLREVRYQSRLPRDDSGQHRDEAFAGLAERDFVEWFWRGIGAE
jgi:hypothetical protein